MSDLAASGVRMRVWDDALKLVNIKIVLFFVRYVYVCFKEKGQVPPLSVQQAPRRKGAPGAFRQVIMRKKRVFSPKYCRVIKRCHFARYVLYTLDTSLCIRNWTAPARVRSYKRVCRPNNRHCSITNTQVTSLQCDNITFAIRQQTHTHKSTRGLFSADIWRYAFIPVVILFGTNLFGLHRRKEGLFHNERFRLRNVFDFFGCIVQLGKSVSFSGGAVFKNRQDNINLVMCVCARVMHYGAL